MRTTSSPHCPSASHPTGDIFAAAEHAAAAGLAFLEIGPNYYDDIEARFGLGHERFDHGFPVDRAVIDGAAEYGRAMPMMMTAAGTVPGIVDWTASEDKISFPGYTPNPSDYTSITTTDYAAAVANATHNALLVQILEHIHRLRRSNDWRRYRRTTLAPADKIDENKPRIVSEKPLKT